MAVINNLLVSIKMIKGDRVLLLLSLIPVLIGILFYGLLGGWVFSSVIPWANDLLQNWLSIEWLGAILGWIIKALMTILLFFVINWTFFLVVSLLASPFNDLISSRVEKKLMGVELGSIGSEFNGFFNKVIFILVNESKKVLIIMLLSLISLALSFFPLLSPLTIFLQAMLVAVNFLDYSWSRHDLKMSECARAYKEKFVENTLAGFIGVILLAIPGVNLVALPNLVVLFTINASYSVTTLNVEKSKQGGK